MPANCSADVAAVIAHVDQTFKGSNTTAIDQLKATFGLENMTHLDDVAGARKYSPFLLNDRLLLFFVSPSSP